VTERASEGYVAKDERSPYEAEPTKRRLKVKHEQPSGTNKVRLILSSDHLFVSRPSFA
jgi:ATP-dependent DNA ligase